MSDTNNELNAADNGIEQFFDFEFADVMEKIDRLKIELKRGTLLCSCGHAKKAHFEVPNRGSRCRPAQVNCRCQIPIPAAYVSDARYFLAATVGNGIDHALSKGLANLTKNGGKAEIILSSQCMICDRSAKLAPVLFNGGGHMVWTTAELTLMLCSECQIAPGQLDVFEILEKLKVRGVFGPSVPKPPISELTQPF
jgi:hypothetical protein